MRTLFLVLSVALGCGDGVVGVDAGAADAASIDCDRLVFDCMLIDKANGRDSGHVDVCADSAAAASQIAGALHPSFDVDCSAKQ